MYKLLKALGTVTLVAGLAAGCASTGGDMKKVSKKNAGHDHDYRTFVTGGTINYGVIKDSYDAELVMYLAGNQFMVMEELIQDFQAKNPDIKSIYVETIPPGQILKGQILKQGQINGKDTNNRPDMFASVRDKHLKKLVKKGIMNSDWIIYTHNKLELMVAKGNPKNIKGAADLGRDDLVQSHPNPKTEGIFKFYGSDMLKDLGIYEKVTGGVKCRGCWAIEGKTWFTKRHHRETPHRIENGKADVGIVWTTEVIEAKRENRGVEGVAISDKYNKGSEVGYAMGILKDGKNQKNAQRYLDYLKTDAAQNIYASYGFAKASSKDLMQKMR